MTSAGAATWWVRCSPWQCQCGNPYRPAWTRVVGVGRARVWLCMGMSRHKNPSPAEDETHETVT